MFAVFTKYCELLLLPTRKRSESGSGLLCLLSFFVPAGYELFMAWELDQGVILFFGKIGASNGIDILGRVVRSAAASTFVS